MPINYDGNTITDCKYDGEQVYKVVYDGAVVWAKSYTITFSVSGYGSWGSSTKTAYYSDTLVRSGNTVTCYTYGDTSSVRWTNTFTKTADTSSYSYSSATYNSITSPVSANQTITATNTRTSLGYAVTITKSYNVSQVYLSTTSTATSGSPSGTTFPSGSTVYGFAKVVVPHTKPSGWTLVSGTSGAENAIYRIGSKTNLSSSYNFGAITIASKVSSETFDVTLSGAGDSKTFTFTGYYSSLSSSLKCSVGFNKSNTSATYITWSSKTSTTLPTSSNATAFATTLQTTGYIYKLTSGNYLGTATSAPNKPYIAITSTITSNGVTGSKTVDGVLLYKYSITLTFTETSNAEANFFSNASIRVSNVYIGL